MLSRKSGGGGRPLASIFEAEGAERAKIGSGTEKEAHFSEDDGEHRDGAKGSPNRHHVGAPRLRALEHVPLTAARGWDAANIGSVQRSGNRLRVNVQLVDAETGNHLWAERFDKQVADLFDMQDEIVSRLANALDTELARRAERSPHPDAMDLVFQGSSWFNKGVTPDCIARARSFFEKAMALDPENIEAMLGLARVDAVLGAAAVTDDWSARLAAAEATTTKVLSLAPNHASAHVNLGVVHIFTKRAAQGIAECQQALALNRNLADAHALIGLAKFFLGRGAETEPHVNEAFRLSPRDTLAPRWMTYGGPAKVQLGADAEAVSWMRRGLDANRNYSLGHFFLGAELARLGELEQARTAVRAGLALDPNFTIHRFRTHTPSDNPIFLASLDFHGAELA